MGILSSLKNALGLNTPVVPREPEPFSLSEAGQRRLDSLPEGHGLHIGTRRAEFGRTVTVDEGELQGPPPAGYERITIGDRDLHRLRGLVLDHQHSGWHVSTHFELRAKETPNPDGRLYLCNRWLAEGRPMFFTTDQAELPDLPALVLGIHNVESVLIRDNTLTVERSRDASWDAIDSGVNTALRRYLLGCGHRLTNEAVAKSGLLSEIQGVLAQTILPAIHADGGDLELVGVDNGVVRVRLQGACRSCPASSATLKHGVERALLEAFPGRVTAVEQV